MLAYKYDIDTKEYLGTQEAQTNPIGGGYLLPAFCTFVEPPTYTEGKIPVYSLNTNKWTVKVDNRGKWQVKLADVTFSKVDYIGKKSGYQVISDEVYEDYQADNDKYKVVDGEFVDISDTEEYRQKKAQEEYERIQSLFMTRSDFFDGLIKAFGIDEDDLLPVLQSILATLPIEEVQKKIAINNFKNALNFYRKHDLFALLSGVTIPISEQLSITIEAEQWDKFFDETNKKNPDAYKELLPKEEE